MALTLGASPQKLDMTLVKSADFMSSIRRKDGTPWPVGCQLTLETTTKAGVTNWDATFSGPIATWSVDQDEVDALIADRIKITRLWYTEGETRLLWAIGEPSVEGVG